MRPNFFDEEETIKYDETTDNKTTNSTHKVCNKILQLGHACYYLYKRQQESTASVGDFKIEIQNSLV
jgi:hypothetical protein